MSTMYSTKKTDNLNVFYENLKWSYQNMNIREKLEDMPGYSLKIDKSHPYNPEDNFHNFICKESSIDPRRGTCDINFGKNRVGLAQHIGLFHDSERR